MRKCDLCGDFATSNRANYCASCKVKLWEERNRIRNKNRRLRIKEELRRLKTL